MRNPDTSPEVITAAQWLADEKEPPAVAVPVLKEKFGLTAVEACDAIRLARDFRICRRAFG